MCSVIHALLNRLCALISNKHGIAAYPSVAPGRADEHSFSKFDLRLGSSVKDTVGETVIARCDFHSGETDI